MNKYKGIIFDLDGTLLDTLADITDSMNITLTEFGYPNFNREDYKLKLGNGFKVLVEKSVPQGTDEGIINKLLNQFVHNYSYNFINKTTPYEGILDVLIKLDSMSIKMGVNSNKRNDYTNELVAKFFDCIPFYGVFGERKGIPKKPDPATANEIANLMNIKQEEILYIGDSNTDILTAINAGMDGVGVLWGFRSCEELKNHGAKYIVSKASDIIDIVNNVEVLA